MSNINKITTATLKLNRIPFTQIPNNVINGMKNGDAFLLWSYLLSKNEGWVIVKEYLCEHFEWGIKKLNNLFNVLSDHGLAIMGQEKSENGKFGKYTITIDGGLNFIKDPVDKSKKPNKINTGHRYPKNRVAVSPLSGKTPAINKDFINNKEKEKIKREALSDFIPDENSQHLARSMKIDLAKELQSFKERHRGKKTQYEFRRWLELAYEHIKSKKITPNNEPIPSRYSNMRDETAERIAREEYEERMMRGVI